MPDGIFRRIEESTLEGPIVLVAEDEEPVQIFYRSRLRRLLGNGIRGFQLFPTGEALVEQLLQENHNNLLVISDRDLGLGMDGFEVLLRVWASCPTIPALIATGDDLPSLHAQWQQQGLSGPPEDYIFNKDAVLEILRAGLPPAKSAPKSVSAS